MIKTRTVFVVGAGASHELEFPLGIDLLSTIREGLDFALHNGKLMFGDAVLSAAVSSLKSDQTSIEDLFDTCRKVCNSTHFGRSIDNVIHQQNDDVLFAKIAKLAIARMILKSETECPLHGEIDDTDRYLRLSQTWLGGFAQLLCLDLDRHHVERIFDNVTVVSFNYDRTILEFIPHVLETQFAMPRAQARTLSQELRILFPYGSLGPLRSLFSDHAVPFGSLGFERVITASEQIRTFTEQRYDKKELSSINQAILEADRIVFLGFGYLPQNMKILTERSAGNASSVLGTSVGLSETDDAEVKSQLKIFLQSSLRDLVTPSLQPIKCADFIQRNFRTLIG